MFWLVVSCLLATFTASLPARSEGYDQCDNRWDAGEPAGPFFELEYAMMAHVLAEKFCEAKPIPMSDKFLGFLEGHDCSADTALHSEMREGLAQLENASLEQLATEGDPSIQMSPDEVHEWARTAVEEFGGCELLISLHDGDLN